MTNAALAKAERDLRKAHERRSRHLKRFHRERYGLSSPEWEAKSGRIYRECMDAEHAVKAAREAA